LALVATSVFVRNGIIPISLEQFRTGQACPMLGPVPACYVVTFCYSAMGLSSAIWRRPFGWVFAVGIAPVLLLAIAGTGLEITGRPTCPRSTTGVPLCFASLAVGLFMLSAYLIAWRLERGKTV
jgi:hypothetical protein